MQTGDRENYGYRSIAVLLKERPWTCVSSLTNEEVIGLATLVQNKEAVCLIVQCYVNGKQVRNGRYEKNVTGKS